MPRQLAMNRIAPTRVPKRPTSRFDPSWRASMRKACPIPETWARTTWVVYKNGALWLTTTGTACSFIYGVFLGVHEGHGPVNQSAVGVSCAIRAFPYCAVAAMNWPLILGYGCWYKYIAD